MQCKVASSGPLALICLRRCNINKNKPKQRLSPRCCGATGGPHIVIAAAMLAGAGAVPKAVSDAAVGVAYMLCCRS